MKLDLEELDEIEFAQLIQFAGVNKLSVEDAAKLLIEQRLHELVNSVGDDVQPPGAGLRH